MPSTVRRNYLYDAAENELWITFVTGRKYVYSAVPPDVFDAFKSAFSRGTFFNREIRDNYTYREVARGRTE